MTYSAVWRVLDEMIVNFRENGLTVPPNIINDLRTTKAMIQNLKAEMSHEGTNQKVQENLVNIEAYLVSEGERRFGKKYVDEWLKRLATANRRIQEDEKENSRFVPGAPREQKWIRVRPSPELSLETLKAWAGEAHLSKKLQIDGSLLVYGKDENLRGFVRKMTKHYTKSKKSSIEEVSNR